MKNIPLNGLDFIEYASPKPHDLENLFYKLGFIKTAQHNKKNVTLYQQGDCQFVINKEESSFAEDFMKQRNSPCVSSIGFRVDIPATKALEIASSRGAKAVEVDSSHSFPAIYGVGGSLIYFVDDYHKEDNHWIKQFSFNSKLSKDPYLLLIDHLTNNVPTGDMNHWCEFYSKIFGFTERRYFDIKGLKTGLLSKVMKSPCDSISIPINEPSADERGKKSQIQEYLDEYQGAGIQHIAFLTKKIIPTIEYLRQRGLFFLDTPSSYYDMLKERLPIVKEDVKDLKRNQILADGDEETYLLQIFTKNVIGPIFFEVIERHGHEGFGEGNFQALFDAIERDQITRGYL
ncbi:MAG: 4-hydroxyphenylpyruvate dioxygenase [Bdellovibrionaceae bacterium]|nr:4-hydroxyphenylpyruvate dioxygenase [Pseudobdellovibrionaceae bacterium]